MSKINNGRPLEAGQRLQIRGYSTHLPLAYCVAESAYRDFNSGFVSNGLREEAVDQVRKDLGITEDFDYRKRIGLELKRAKAAVINFDYGYQCYMDAWISEPEISMLIRNVFKEIPYDAQALLDVDPEEVIMGCLDLREGQPISIHGEREHLPQILKLLHWAYENRTKLADVSIEEEREFDLTVPLYQYGSDDALKYVSGSVLAMYKEYLAKRTARLFLDGIYPGKYEGIDPEKIQLRSTAVAERIRPYKTDDVPWCVYYLPTVLSAKASGYANLRDAALDVKKINHSGQIVVHAEKLGETTNRLNKLIREGYNTLHFVSVNPVTRTPDGKTDIKFTLTPKSVFVSGSVTTSCGQKYIPNVPTEESFTTPDCTKTEGIVTMTRPSIINGYRVSGIKMKFKNGKVINASAEENERVLIEWIRQNENADMAGEIAVVAGSPIYDLDRVFNLTVIDENTASHFALGGSYPMCVEGANEIKNVREKKGYLAFLNCNNSPVHRDFIIGSPNVWVYFKKPDGTRKLLISDNKFQV